MSNNLLVCIGDGDNIGDTIELYLLSGNLEEASQFSDQVKTAITDIAKLVQDEIEAYLIDVAGDDICFLVSAETNITDYLITYSDLFLKVYFRFIQNLKSKI
ncbi:hypothetical protein [Nostoc sp.]|uniref:hypothetical protein n=1 Tax=Nostoc sp. TaxID=1180 RepID=UPI002FFC76BB